MSGRRPHPELAGLEARLASAGLTGRAAFDAVVQGLDGYGPASEVSSWPPEARPSLLAACWQRLLPDAYRADRGQYFTPDPLADLLASRWGPLDGRMVVDPMCGAGALLRAAARRGARVAGCERDPGLVGLARSTVPGGDVVAGDGLVWAPGSVDAVLANPPFDDAAVSGLVGFLARTLGPGGCAAVVWPWAFATGRRWRSVRTRLEGEFAVTAAARLPEGCFRPFGGAGGRAVVTWLKRRPTPEVGALDWIDLVDLGWDSRSVRGKRTSGAQLADAILGIGWTRVKTWPPAVEAAGIVVSDVAKPRREAPKAGAPRLDLGDVGSDGVAGPGGAGGARKGRVRVRPGDVVLSRIRPERGTVGRHIGPEERAGSGEWVVLEVPDEIADLLVSVLRSPAFRDALPAADGVTHPRLDPDVLLGARLPWPQGELGRRVSAALSALRRRRARDLAALAHWQAAIDAFARTGDEGRLRELLGEPE